MPLPLVVGRGPIRRGSHVGDVESTAKRSRCSAVLHDHEFLMMSGYMSRKLCSWMPAHDVLQIVAYGRGKLTDEFIEGRQKIV